MEQNYERHGGYELGPFDTVDPSMLTRHANVEDAAMHGAFAPSDIIDDVCGHLVPAKTWSASEAVDGSSIDWAELNIFLANWAKNTAESVNFLSEAPWEGFGSMSSQPWSYDSGTASLIDFSPSDFAAIAVHQPLHTAHPGIYLNPSGAYDLSSSEATFQQMASSSMKKKKTKSLRKKPRSKKKPEELMRYTRRVTKPEICTECGKGHDYSKHLDRHMVANHRHVAEKLGLDVSKVKCPNCALECDNIRKDRLLRHMKKCNRRF